MEGGLRSAGLSRFIPRFTSEGVTEEAFKSLVEKVRELRCARRDSRLSLTRRGQDYSRFGIEAVADRQKLLKLVRSLNPPTPPAGPPRSPYGSPPAARRPASSPQRQLPRRPATAPNQLSQQGSPSQLLPSLEALSVDEPLLVEWAGAAAAEAAGADELPRIRVLVRKRPLNARERTRNV